MKYRTFKDWNERGKIIKKGEKAAGFLVDGTPIFGEEQVKKRPKRNVSLQHITPDSWYMGDGEDYS